MTIDTMDGFLTSFIKIFESPNTWMYFTPRLISLYKPWTSASYSIVLFVNSNSNVDAKIVFSPSGFIKMHPAPAPSLDWEPSKYKVQNKYLTTSLITIFRHMDESVYDFFLIWQVTELTKKGDSCALKIHKKDS